MTRIKSRLFALGATGAMLSLFVVGVGGAAAATEGTFPAAVVKGTCAKFDAVPAFTLTNVGGDSKSAKDSPVGAKSAVPVEKGTSTLKIAFADLAKGPYAIDVMSAKDNKTQVACGDIGGQPVGTGTKAFLAIGLNGAKGSGTAGIAVLQAVGTDTTKVTVYLAQGITAG